MYEQDVNSLVERPLKELKGFEKVFLEPNQASSIKLELKAADFAYYDDNEHFWKVTRGFYNIIIGSSSRDIRLQTQVEYVGPKELI